MKPLILAALAILLVVVDWTAEDGLQPSDPYPASLLPEPDWRLLDYAIGHSESDTRRMQERAHYGWHRDNPDRTCEHPEIPQLAEGMGFWERLRA